MKKIALIIGNSAYAVDKLKNPKNDANAMAEILEYKGFEVTKVIDANNISMKANFTSFISSIKDGDTALFYFAGHGIEDKKTNFILSTNYTDLFGISEEELSLEYIQNQMYGVNKCGIKLIILDACRDNPGLLESEGDSSVVTLHNTLIAYSTSPNNTAKDGLEELSRYTKHLVENIKKYNLNILEVFSKTRESVMQETKFKQVPWEHSSLIDSFTFDNIKVPKKLENMIRISNSRIYSIKFYKDDYIFIGDNSFITIWNRYLSRHKNIQNIKDADEMYSIEDFDINDSYLVVVDSKKKFNIYDSQYNIKASKKFKNMTFFTVSINKNNIVLLGGIGKKVLFWDISQDSEKYCFKIDADIYCSNIHNENDNIFAFAGSKSTFEIFDFKTKKILFSNQKRNLFKYTYDIQFSLDGRLIATGHEDGLVMFWCAKTYEVLKTVNLNKYIKKNEFFEFKEEEHSNHILSVKFSPNSDFLVVGTSESSLVFIDLKYYTTIDIVDISLEPLAIYSIGMSKEGDEIMISLDSKVYKLII